MAKLPKIIYLMGPPGAGKGTQAKLLCEAVDYHNFSTGDAFREVARKDTDLGHRVKEIIENGFLAPPEMAAEIVIDAVQQYLPDTGLVFDGTPRTVKEAEIIDEYFLAQGSGRPLVIFLQLDKAEMIKRNSQRKFCLGISGDFPVVTKADKDKCAQAGGHIGTRPDDEPEKFATRWEQFMTLTHPVVEQYRAQDMFHELDGMKSIPDVQQQITAVIDSYESD